MALGLMRARPSHQPRMVICPKASKPRTAWPWCLPTAFRQIASRRGDRLSWAMAAFGQASFVAAQQNGGNWGYVGRGIGRWGS